jgi:hypothetical protein
MTWEGHQPQTEQEPFSCAAIDFAPWPFYNAVSRPSMNMDHEAEASLEGGESHDMERSFTKWEHLK